MHFLIPNAIVNNMKHHHHQISHLQKKKLNKQKNNITITACLTKLVLHTTISLLSSIFAIL